MKAQRRHELQQNVLGLELKRLGDFVRNRSNLLAWALLGIAVVILAVVLWYKYSQRKEAEFAGKFNSMVVRVERDLRNEDRIAGLKDLVENDSNKLRAADACYELASLYTRMALATNNDNERKTFIEQAVEQYKTVFDRFPNESQIAAKAHMGLGKLAESVGDWNQAEVQYRAVLNTPEVAKYPIAKQAQVELDALKSRMMPIKMATTTSAPSTRPTSGPAGATMPSGEAAAATAPTATTLPEPAIEPTTLPASVPAAAP